MDFINDESFNLVHPIKLTQDILEAWTVNKLFWCEINNFISKHSDIRIEVADAHVSLLFAIMGET
jgi:hypothetical protein